MSLIRVVLSLSVAATVVLGPAPVRAAAAGVAYDGRISRELVMLRAADWMRRDVPYSQDNRDAVWDANRGRRYRPDCSGFVSMVWALDPRRPGLGRALVTWELPSVSTRIRWAQMLRGDILLHLVPGDRAKGHVVVFQAWLDTAKTRAWIVEESGHADDMVRKVVTVAAIRYAYQPYRYERIY